MILLQARLIDFLVICRLVCCCCCVYYVVIEHEFFLVVDRVFMFHESVDSNSVVTYSISVVSMLLSHRLLCFVVIDPYG